MTHYINICPTCSAVDQCRCPGPKGRTRNQCRACKGRRVTPRAMAQEIVDGFFIGGGGDDLMQPNMTKSDLANAIAFKIMEAEKGMRAHCAGLAEQWTPDLPNFESPSITAAFDQLDAKIRPIQVAAAKEIAKRIREDGGTSAHCGSVRCVNAAGPDCACTCEQCR